MKLFIFSYVLMLSSLASATTTYFEDDPFQISLTDLSSSTATSGRISSQSEDVIIRSIGDWGNANIHPSYLNLIFPTSIGISDQIQREKFDECRQYMGIIFANTNENVRYTLNLSGTVVRAWEGGDGASASIHVKSISTCNIGKYRLKQR